MLGRPVMHFYSARPMHLLSGVDIATQAGPLSGEANAAHIPGAMPKRALHLSEPQSRRAASSAFCCVSSFHA
jgi:hypothetical protein